MLTAIIICFIVGYLIIVFEHPLRLDKTVPALIMGALCWAFVSYGHLDVVNAEHELGHIDEVLLHHIGKVAEILIFLIGAMTIVELIDLHKGFAVITNKIKTTKKSTLLWILGFLAFFLSATLDNLASTIVLVSLLRRLVPDKKERLWFVSMAVIAANAGGAWSPIGDVTTTMLWIGKKVSTGGLISHLVLPSIICMVVPFFVASLMKPFKGQITSDPNEEGRGRSSKEKLLSSSTMLYVGIGALVFVPVFKTITHLPPYVGMMLALGVVWLVSEYINPEEELEDDRKHLYSAHQALSRIEMSSILFFLGILMAVAALESVAVMYNGHETGLLMYLAELMQAAIPNQNLVVLILGGLSAIIDNVPLVAASMGMYTKPMDDSLWHFIAYSAGTGGSMLIIGSAAGVAAMGMERINFIWYVKNVTWLAFLGFISGAGVFIVMQSFF
ncbi:MAG TPA: sodium:proton antiporter NhaD [Saprospiraceae bacterium]|nr:sodium:proton antiporter NhaD [Saprospiraceae bacterium]